MLKDVSAQICQAGHKTVERGRVQQASALDHPASPRSTIRIKVRNWAPVEWACALSERSCSLRKPIYLHQTFAWVGNPYKGTQQVIQGVLLHFWCQCVGCRSASTTSIRLAVMVMLFLRDQAMYDAYTPTKGTKSNYLALRLGLCVLVNAT